MIYFHIGFPKSIHYNQLAFVVRLLLLLLKKNVHIKTLKILTIHNLIIKNSAHLSIALNMWQVKHHILVTAYFICNDQESLVNQLALGE